MNQDFRWNPYADQPHTVTSKKERLKFYFRDVLDYIPLLAANMRRAFPVLRLYRKYRKKMYLEPVCFKDTFGISVSPEAGREEEMLEGLLALGLRHALVRIPSWEKDNLDVYEKFITLLHSQGIQVVTAVLQRRKDVQNLTAWAEFLKEIFSRFGCMVSFFEIGHAWNRKKWGVWNCKEYLKLAFHAVPLAKKYGVKLLGPAVIDFEFHFYPPVLGKIPFDTITSLLYVDRKGAPENTQFGWDTSKKTALLRAVVDGCLKQERELWITEVNWPLAGTGKYSPAVGRVNVSEEKQADYLVRYFVLCLTSGFIQRIYWWQLVAPGYGLIDSRGQGWRKRPSFFAMANMVKHLEGSTFLEKIPYPEVNIFAFRGKNNPFAVCWTQRASVDSTFTRPILKVYDRDGKELSFKDNRVRIISSPVYVHFHE